MRLAVVFACLLSTGMTGCVELLGGLSGLGKGVAAANSDGLPSVSIIESGLLVYGGKNHDVFLGCLCNKYDAKSIHNASGQFGSRYSAISIFNSYGDYGSRYAPTSACNRYASDPPVIVTSGGALIGRLTVNTASANPPPKDVAVWLAGVCGG